MREKFSSYLRDRRIRYLFIGGSSAAIEYGSFLLLMLLGKEYLIFASCVSFAIGFFYTFFLHKYWTFKGEHTNTGKKQFLLYASLATFNIFATSLIIDLQVNVIGVPPFIAKIVCMGLVVVWNYLILNRAIFKTTNP